MITITIQDDDIVGSVQEVSTTVSNPKKIYFETGKLIVRWLKARCKTTEEVYDEPDWTPEEQERSRKEIEARKSLRKMLSMKEAV